MGFNAYIIGFADGILTFISPCILPLVPLYIFYLAGAENGGPEAQGKSKAGLVINALGFVLGFTVIFVALGAAATTIGHFLRANILVFRKISGVIMIIFGLNFMGVLKLGFLNRVKKLDYEIKKPGFTSSIVFGMVFSFGWTPCVGAFLGSVLLMAANSDTMWRGMLLLLVYSLGLGVPFVITSILFEKLKKSFKKLQQYSKIISIVSGIVLILAGILIYTDRLKYLSALTW